MEVNSETVVHLMEGIELPNKPRFLNKVSIILMLLAVVPIVHGAKYITDTMEHTGITSLAYVEVSVGILIEALCIIYLIGSYVKKRKEYWMSINDPYEYKRQKAYQFIKDQREKEDYYSEKYEKHKKKRTKLDDSGAYAYIRAGHLTVEWDPEIMDHEESQENKEKRRMS